MVKMSPIVLFKLLLVHCLVANAAHKRLEKYQMCPQNHNDKSKEKSSLIITKNNLQASIVK